MTQQTIPGTNRKDDPDVEAACLRADDADAKWSEAGKKKADRKAEVAAIMKARGLKVYKFWVPRLGRHRIARLDPQDPKFVFEDTDEGDGEVGEGIEAPPAKKKTTPDKAMRGLIDSANKAQADAGVSETDEGDVVAPDTSAPKKPRRGKAKKK